MAVATLGSVNLDFFHFSIVFLSFFNCIYLNFQLYFSLFSNVFLSLFNCISFIFQFDFFQFSTVFLSLFNCISLTFQLCLSYGIRYIFTLCMKCIFLTSCVCDSSGNSELVNSGKLKFSHFQKCIYKLFIGQHLTWPSRTAVH